MDTRTRVAGVAALIVLAAVIYGVLKPKPEVPGVLSGVNSQPVVESVTISDQSYGAAVDPLTVSGAGQILYVHGTISDADGCAEIEQPTQLSGDFYETSAGSCSGAPNCFSVGGMGMIDECDPGDASDTQARYQFELSMAPEMFVSPPVTTESWTVEVTVDDINNASGTGDDVVGLQILVPATPTPTVEPIDDPALVPDTSTSAWDWFGFGDDEPDPNDIDYVDPALEYSEPVIEEAIVDYDPALFSEPETEDTWWDWIWYEPEPEPEYDPAFDPALDPELYI